MPVDTQIPVSAVTQAPSEWTVPPAFEMRLKAVHASMDGSAAAATWLPVVEIVSDSGHVIARALDPNITVAAGASVDASWFPIRRRTSAQAPTTFALAVRCIAFSAQNLAAFVKVDLGLQYNDVWLHADVAFSTAFVNEEIANLDTQPIMATWHNVTHRDDVSLSAGLGAPAYFTWNQKGLTRLFSPVVANTWYTLDFRTHIVGANTQFELYVNGVSVGAIPPHLGVAQTVNIVSWGFADGDFSLGSGFDAAMWFRNCKVGSTQGAGDLFDDGGYPAGTIEPPFTTADGYPALVPEPFILGRGPDLWP